MNAWAALGFNCGECDTYLSADNKPQYRYIPCSKHRQREWKLFNSIIDLSETIFPSDLGKRIAFVNGCYEVYTCSYLGEPTAVQHLTDLIYKEGFTTSRYEAMNIASGIFTKK